MSPEIGRSWSQGLEIEFELRRIGVDLLRLGSLATTGAVTHRDLVQWLRRQPTGLGHAAFLARFHDSAVLQLPAEAEDIPADPSFVDPEFEEERAFASELERVAPTGSDRPPAAGETHGLNFPQGRAHALAVMRTLPNGVGLSALAEALHAGPPQSDSARDPGA